MVSGKTDYKLIVLGLFIVLGAFLIRGGITGKVISQSCCFGPDCAAEDICPAANQPSLEQPAFLGEKDSNALSYTGLLISVISVCMVIGYLGIDLQKKKMAESSGKHSASAA